MNTKRFSSNYYIFRLFFVAALFFSMLSAKPVQAAENTELPVEKLLNFDGTLNLSTGYSGSLDIGNYDITMDPVYGPILKPLSIPDTWSALGGGVTSDVYSVALSGSDIYAAGAFTDVGANVNIDRIAKWNGSAWSAFNTGLADGAKAIAIDGTNVYVGGYFLDAGGNASADYIAKWNGVSWSSLGATPLNGYVYAISISGSNIYVGGNFTNAGGDVNADRIAKWNGVVWSALGTGLSGAVETIAISGADIYAGGVFTNAGGDPTADYIAKWNGAAWSALGSGLSSDVNSIAISGTDVYAGGSFIDAGGNVAADYIARWSGSAWYALGAAALNGAVESIAINGADLYAGGYFQDAGGSANADYIAKWNGVSWSALGVTPLNDAVLSVAVNGPEIYAGGKFLNAGGDAGADFIAKFVPITTILVNSILPTSRSVPVGTTATIYNTVINGGLATATNVVLSITPAPSGTFSYYQTNCATNAIVGAVNPSLNLDPGAVLCYVLLFTPSASFSATSVHIRAVADNAPYTSLWTGVNTWLLRSTASAGPDIIALTTTTDFHQVSCLGTNVFALALSNVGVAATGDITAFVHTGGVSLPLTFLAVESDPGSGTIIGDHIFQNVIAGDNRTMVIFVNFNNCIAFDPSVNRIFIEFRDDLNNIVGSTSTAVSTNR